jgi:hypothetical protein
MLEFIKHLFGMCGENHPSFFTLFLPVSAFILNVYIIIKFRFINFLNLFKSKLLTKKQNKK